jgi:SAM-dependent MidA family methyltransferase
VELAGYLDDHGVALDVDQVAELSLAAAALHERLLGRCGAAGIALVLEYGYPAARLYDSRGRRHGSLVAYRRHRPERDVLAAPGESDLTAHVNLDDLSRAARVAGWCEVATMPLAEALVRGGLGEVLEAEGLGPEAPLDARTVTARQEVKRLLDPDGMGSDLKLVVQATPSLAERVDKLLADGPANHRG